MEEESFAYWIFLTKIFLRRPFGDQYGASINEIMAPVYQWEIEKAKKGWICVEYQFRKSFIFFGLNIDPLFIYPVDFGDLGKIVFCQIYGRHREKTMNAF